MKRDLYIIPDREHIEDSLSLCDLYDCKFEYNDFYRPDVLDSRQKQKYIIDFYRNYVHDFSHDTMHGAFFDVTLHSGDPKIQEISRLRVRQSMEIAEELGVKAVIFHTGRIQGFREKNYIENWLTENESFFRSVLNEFKEQQIYMENMFDEAPDILAKLAKRMQDESRFGVCMDYAHAAVFGTDLEEWLPVLAPYIRHIHINDNNLAEDQHLSIGLGVIDWKHFNERIVQYQIESSVLIEVGDSGLQRSSIEYMVKNHIYPR